MYLWSLSLSLTSSFHSTCLFGLLNQFHIFKEHTVCTALYMYSKHRPNGWFNWNVLENVGFDRWVHVIYKQQENGKMKVNQGPSIYLCPKGDVCGDYMQLPRWDELALLSFCISSCSLSTDVFFFLIFFHSDFFHKRLGMPHQNAINQARYNNTKRGEKMSQGKNTNCLISFEAQVSLQQSQFSQFLFHL